MQEKPESVLATLELTRTEERILMRLTRQSCLSREQVCGIATCGHRSIKLSSVNGVGGLRRKLTKHKIELATVNGFGFELRQRDLKQARDSPPGDVLVGNPTHRVEWSPKRAKRTQRPPEDLLGRV
jgi:hypothetical protein